MLGFCSVTRVDPSPKYHFHSVGEPVLVLANLTFSGAFPDRGLAEKTATGFTGAVTFI